jgi:hypothetical protein
MLRERESNQQNSDKQSNDGDNAAHLHPPDLVTMAIRRGARCGSVLSVRARR